MSDPYERIIWSADVHDVPTLLEWLDELPRLRYVKIDRAFVDANGWGVFAELEERGIKVFDDAKIIEIPSKLEQIAQTHCQKAQPWMLNCMAGAISNGNHRDNNRELDGLKRFADMCHIHDVAPCAVSVLTSKSPTIVSEEFGCEEVHEAVLYYTEHLERAGFTHMVCSPPVAAWLQIYKTNLKLVTPGVRPSGARKGDQNQVDTPAGAIQNGSNYLVIGRPITEGPGTPAENLAAIAEEITVL
ncbi:orotidine 5'-phosphate decarboxylase [Candidatus Saccharibacteria bacterium]|nr:orotidine 5'-phosphate decarboxylase [Candidatus Saccharibacteria bacterium]